MKPKLTALILTAICVFAGIIFDIAYHNGYERGFREGGQAAWDGWVKDPEPTQVTLSCHEIERQRTAHYVGRRPFNVTSTGRGGGSAEVNSTPEAYLP